MESSRRVIIHDGLGDRFPLILMEVHTRHALYALCTVHSLHCRVAESWTVTEILENLNFFLPTAHFSFWSVFSVPVMSFLVPECAFSNSDSVPKVETKLFQPLSTPFRYVSPNVRTVCSTTPSFWKMTNGISSCGFTSSSIGRVRMVTRSADEAVR